MTTLSRTVEDIRAAQRENKEQISLVVKRDGATRYLGLQLATG